MKIIAIICNLVLAGFTCLIVLEEGDGREAVYILFTWLLVLIPILSSLIVFRGGMINGWNTFSMKTTAPDERMKAQALPSEKSVVKIITIICNMLLLGFVCWAIVDQYPHPDEAGVLGFVLLAIGTPILNAVVLLRTARGDGWLGLGFKGKAAEEPLRHQ